MKENAVKLNGECETVIPVERVNTWFKKKRFRSKPAGKIPTEARLPTGLNSAPSRRGGSVSTAVVSEKPSQCNQFFSFFIFKDNNCFFRF